MNIRVRGIARCTHYDGSGQCPVEIEVWMGFATDIEIDCVPKTIEIVGFELPEGWSYYYGELKCPEHQREY